MKNEHECGFEYRSTPALVISSEHDYFFKILNLSFLFYFFHSLKDFKEFGEVIEAVKDKGVSVVVASPEDVHAANKERSNFFDVKKAL